MRNQMPNQCSILLVEDSPTKSQAISVVVESVGIQNLKLSLAPTLEVAKSAISDSVWDLVILDISMDIRSSSSGPREGGHDATGGLKIAERMYLLGQETKVIVVTAFDAFPTDDRKRGTVLGLEEVLEQARRWLGDYLVGWVRYGDHGWNHLLDGQIRKALSL